MRLCRSCYFVKIVRFCLDIEFTVLLLLEKPCKAVVKHTLIHVGSCIRADRTSKLRPSMVEQSLSCRFGLRSDFPPAVLEKALRPDKNEQTDSSRKLPTKTCTEPWCGEHLQCDQPVLATLCKLLSSAWTYGSSSYCCRKSHAKPGQKRSSPFPNYNCAVRVPT